jgi:hypothetical protein
MTTDRHKTTARLIRPDPADLLEKLDERVGTGRRSKAISLLVGRFLAGRPMPSVPEAVEELDNWGQDHGA